jgi:putative ABC transport system permease protein
MVVAVINFINLSNANATLRLKEVFIKKISGANYNHLIFQFLGESVAISFISIFVALLFAQFLIHFINNQNVLNLPLEFFSIPGQLLILTIGSLVIGLLAGIYPAISLSSIGSSLTEKKHMYVKAKFIRTALLIIQFFISTGLIICTLVMSRQFKYMTNTDTGYNSNNVICLRMSSELKKNYVPFVNMLLQSPVIERVAHARYGFVADRKPYNLELTCKGNPVQGSFISFNTDTGFMEIINLKLINGSSFEEFNNIRNKIILNETALNSLNYDGDLNDIKIEDEVHKITWQVVGIVKDFNCGSMHHPVSPFVIYYTPGDPDMDGLYIKLKSSDPLLVDKTVKFIKDTWPEFSPNEPFNIEFLDDTRIRLYNEDEGKKKLLFYFSVFAVFISCLGLYGLSGFILAWRRKEIGIRKVYGADNRAVFGLLIFDFLKLVFYSFILVIPFTWFIMEKWLQNFSLKTTLDWWIFVIAGLIIIMISFFTIGIEIWKASIQNPARIITYE